MSVRVTIVSAIKPDIFEKLLPFLEENLPNVRSFKGCLQVTVLLSLDKCVMSFDEVWLSCEHHQAYMASIEQSGVLGRLASYLRAPPVLSYFEELAV